MTPKEKAKELVDKFLDITPVKDFINLSAKESSDELLRDLKVAKQCALICIDRNIELLRSFEHRLEIDCGNDYFKDDIEELEEVKQEIKQLN